MPSAPEEPRFSGRLWPSPGIWAAAIGFGAALGLIPAPISTEAGTIVAVVGSVSLVTLLLVTTPTVTVTAETFTAGRARIPVTVVSEVEELDVTAMRQAHGVDLDARAYLCVRGWLPTGVKVVLKDPEDPTPYWLVSSRRPRALIEALRAEIERSGRTG
jgi:hypothetical protein